jgi:hypothetical protein
VHGSNAKILSVELSLPQISKNAVSFLLFLVFSLHKIENKRAEQVLPGSKKRWGGGGQKEGRARGRKER